MHIIRWSSHTARYLVFGFAVFTGSTAVPPPTTLPSPYRPPPALQTEYVGRPAAPYPPAPGGIGSFSCRPGPPARPLPALMGPAAGRLPAAPPFAMGPRPPFPVPLGHPRMDARWPRPRHPGGGFLVPPNGVQPPPPPVGDPSGGRTVVSFSLEVNCIEICCSMLRGAKEVYAVVSGSLTMRSALHAYFMQQLRWL